MAKQAGRLFEGYSYHKLHIFRAEVSQSGSTKQLEPPVYVIFFSTVLQYTIHASHSPPSILKKTRFWFILMIRRNVLKSLHYKGFCSIL